MKRAVAINVVWFAMGCALLVIPPALGIHLAGRDLADYMAFPPRTLAATHAPFAWPAFIGLALLALAALLPFVCRMLTAPLPFAAQPPSRRPFPWWGWAGVAFTLVAWALAWGRFRWCATLQPFTFTPLWIGYIVTMNALTQARGGAASLTRAPRRLLALTVGSAVFWWYFEYLNRFAMNWRYENIGALSALQYFTFATLPFATVLPAVIGTADWLATFPRLGAGLGLYVIVRPRHPRRIAGVALCVAVSGLAGIGLWPDWLFPLLWLAPLLVITALQALARRTTLFTPLRAGDWTRLVRFALAALVCGFFWELWNVASLARWVYQVPHVARFHLFEMPLLGYLGYLPFGLECAAIADLIAPHRQTDDAPKERR